MGWDEEGFGEVGGERGLGVGGCWGEGGGWRWGRRI